MNGTETAAPAVAQSAPAEVRQIKMSKYSDHKAVVRYKAADGDAVISDVYVKKTLTAVMPRDIIVTVAPA